MQKIKKEVNNNNKYDSSPTNDEISIRTKKRQKNTSTLSPPNKSMASPVTSPRNISNTTSSSSDMLFKLRRQALHSIRTKCESSYREVFMSAVFSCYNHYFGPSFIVCYYHSINSYIILSSKSFA